MANNGVPFHIAVQHNTMVYLRNKGKHGVNPYRDVNGNYASNSNNPKENS